MNKIITIGREFGRRLAEQLGYAYYDQEIVREISQRTSLSEQYVQAVMEHHPAFSFPIHVGRSFYPAVNPAFEQTMAVWKEQAGIITEVAEKSDCVIVGRCADYILREREPFRIFVYADMESRIRRCHEKAPEDERLTDKELRQKISGVDKRRARYYESYTGHLWGDRLNYDLCIRFFLRRESITAYL